VTFSFERLGHITYSLSISYDKLFEVALEAGAQDVSTDDDAHHVLCHVEDIGRVRDALESHIGEAASVKLIWQPTTPMAVTGENATSILKLLDALDDNDDVQAVFSNADIDAAIITEWQS
jgi:transcriptional/translational regulatory protein YebC/TACO1